MSRRFSLTQTSNMRGGGYFKPGGSKAVVPPVVMGSGLRRAGVRSNAQASKMWRARQRASIQRRSTEMAQQQKAEKKVSESKVPMKKEQEGEGLAPRVRVALEENPLHSGHSELKSALMKFGSALKKKKAKKAKVVKPAQKLKKELLKLSKKI
jgi:hypothetical protein